MKALGAYIFAGGFTVGVKRHFDVVAHLEGSDYGVATARLNWPDMPIRFPKAKWGLDDPDFARRVADLDFVYANPPCAIFSPMGIVTTQGADSWKTDPRLECWKDSVELVERLKPRAFALESVPQAYTRGRALVDDFTRVGLRLGYSVTHLLLDAKWTGIPQSRKRFFLVFHRRPALAGYQFNFAPPPTVGEVLKSVPDPGHYTVFGRPGWAKLIADTVPGERLSTTWMRQNPDFDKRRNSKGQVIGRPSFQDRRLNADEVMGAWVGDKFYHPTEARFVGVEEAKAICGYPPDFQIAPKDLRGFGSLLARAVMPPVGEWLARAIATTLTTRETGRLTVTRVDVREPGIAPVDLTAKYLDRDMRVIEPEATVKSIYGIELAPATEETTVMDDEEVEELTGASRTIAAATSASSLQGPREPAPREDTDEVQATPRGAPLVRRDGNPSGEAALDAAAAMTGIDPAVVRRVATALFYGAQGLIAAKITGATADDVERVGWAIAVAEGDEDAVPRDPEGSAVLDAGRVPARQPDDVAAGEAGPRLPVEAVADARSCGRDAGARASPLAETARVTPGARLEPPALGARVDADGSASVGAKARGRPRAAGVRKVRGGQLGDLRERGALPPDGLGAEEVPREGEGSGAFIRRMLLLDRRTPEEILAVVLASFEGRKTTIKDVYWNYQKLTRDGADPPPWRGKKTPGGYPGAKSPEGRASRPKPEEAPAAQSAPQPRAAGALSEVDRYLAGES